MRSSVVAAAVALVIATNAHAAPIAAGSMLSIYGLDIFTPTSMNFEGLGSISSDSGNFTILASCISCVDMFDFNSTDTDFPVYRVTQGAVTSTLTLASAMFVETPGPGSEHTLTVTGNGTETLTGFDPTPGQWSLVTQGADNAMVDAFFTFRVGTQNAVPPTSTSEPSGLGLFAMALLALAFWGWARGADRRVQLSLRPTSIPSPISFIPRASRRADRTGCRPAEPGNRKVDGA